MKKFKNVLIVMLALVTMFTFMSCEQPNPEPPKFEPKKTEITVNEAVSQPFALTDIYQGVASGKCYVVTNVSNKPASLDGYWMATWNKDKTKFTANNFPAVTVAPGCSVVFMNNGYDYKLEDFVESNNFTNIENLINLGSAKEPTEVTEVKDNNAYFQIWFAVGDYDCYFGKGEAKEENAIESKKMQKKHWFEKDLTTNTWTDKGDVNGKGEANATLRAEFNDKLAEIYIIK